jgi:hypothetical protein
MENFNIITDNLSSCKSYGVFYIIGKCGDINKMRDKKQNWDAGDNTECMLLIYNKQNDTIAWKFVKRSNKGFYIQMDQRIYLDDFS